MEVHIQRMETLVDLVEELAIGLLETMLANVNGIKETGEHLVADLQM
jgi:hypothetical protein